MTPVLSIVIPCYNCEKTLREAVDSCYKQKLSTDEFEIIMVDDASSDSTQNVMRAVAKEHENIRLLFHEVNRGGGAARNTGIKEAQGGVIYCLDSDNIFADNSVKPMLEHLKNTRSDGVAFHDRRFFYNTNRSLFRSHLNTVTDRPIELIDIFNDTDTLLDNFFYTKTSYLQTAGYPEHHGFDTQCFELRYLAAGHTVQVCPGSIFYHRQGASERSYFERVHALGLFSINFMLAFEDIFHLFKPTVQKLLVEYPIFADNKSYAGNIVSILKDKVRNGEAIFTADLGLYCIPDGRNKWLTNNAAAKNEARLVKTYAAYDGKTFTKAHETLVEYVNETKNISPYIQFLFLRILHGLSGTDPSKIVSQTLSDIQQLQVTPIKEKSVKIANWLRANPRLYAAAQKLRSILK
jgi:glycosyltransferase involved in cell wall biosynthesis